MGKLTTYSAVPRQNEPAGQTLQASPSAEKKPAAQTQSAFAELPFAAAACSGQRLITPSRHHVSAGHSLHWPPLCFEYPGLQTQSVLLDAPGEEL
eukprot:2426434-Rhodomonas_salina.1